MKSLADTKQNDDKRSMIFEQNSLKSQKGLQRCSDWSWNPQNQWMAHQERWSERQWKTVFVEQCTGHAPQVKTDPETHGDPQNNFSTEHIGSQESQRQHSRCHGSVQSELVWSNLCEFSLREVVPHQVSFDKQQNKGCLSLFVQTFNCLWPEWAGVVQEDFFCSAAPLVVPLNLDFACPR